MLPGRMVCGVKHGGTGTLISPFLFLIAECIPLIKV